MKEIEIKDSKQHERVFLNISNYLKMWCNIKGITPATDDIIEFYVKRLSSYSLPEIQEACDYSFEKFKTQRHFVAPSELRQLIEENRRATPGVDQRGPMKVSEANFNMLELFLRAFRESNLKGKDLENHLKQIVEENYDALGCKDPVCKCQRCKDRGYVNMWFLVEKGLIDRHQKDADGKLRTYREQVRVANAPYWEQEAQPDFEPPAGQQLVNGVCRCDCHSGERFSFPKLPANSVPF